MNKKLNKETPNSPALFFKTIGNFITDNWRYILIFLAGILISTAIVYLDANTTETVASFALDEYEVGQISDKTVIAQKAIPEDVKYPIAIEKGEKVIRKGFPITEEEFFKLQKMADSPVYVDYRAFSDEVLYIILISLLWCLLFNPVLLKRKVEVKEAILELVLFLFVFSVSTFGMKYAVLPSGNHSCHIFGFSCSHSFWSDFSPFLFNFDFYGSPGIFCLSDRHCPCFHDPAGSLPLYPCNLCFCIKNCS